MVMIKALTASLLLTAIVADHDQYNGDDSIDFGKIEKKANRAIQGVRDLRQGRLKQGLREKIEEIAAEIAEQKIAEAIANFVPPAPPASSTQKPFIPTTAPSYTFPQYFPVGNETSGVITSPNYPNNYPPNVDQYYHIYVPGFGDQYTGISLTLKDFDLEGTFPECKYDNLTLTHYNSRKRRGHNDVVVDYTNSEGSGFSDTDYTDFGVDSLVDPEVEAALFSGPFCGSEIQLNVTLDVPVSFITLQFKSDSYIEKKGFAIEWSFIEKDAAPPTEAPAPEIPYFKTQLTSENFLGQFATPNYGDGNYTDNVGWNDHYNYFESPSAQGLFIQFDRFDIEYGEVCYDYLQFEFTWVNPDPSIERTVITWDGQDAQNFLTEEVCGKYNEATLNGIPMISSNSYGFYVDGAYGVTVRFVSDTSVVKEGAYLDIFAIPAELQFESADPCRVMRCY